MQRSIWQRFLSRKFVLAAAMAGVGILIATGKITPAEGDAINRAVEVLAGALLSAASVGAYVVAEAKVDSTR